MAPPPPANLPLGERLLQLVQTLQFAWFAGHLTLLICLARYSLSWLSMNWYSRMGQLTYRTAFISAALTYGIVVYKTWRARQKVGAKYPGSLVGLLSDENVQYLIMALVWLFAPQYPLALLPYGIYSVFHVATYTRANVIPTVQPSKPAPAGSSPGAKQTSPIAEAIGNFVKAYYDASMSIVSSLEILLWSRLLLAAIFFQRWSWILITLYTAFIRARFAQSSHVQNAFGSLEAYVDSLLNDQNMPPAARQSWDAVKNVARQFHDLTDLSKYINNGTAVPKKTS